MIDSRDPDLEHITPADVRERLMVAMGVLDEIMLPRETRKIVNFAIAMTLILASFAPDLLVIMAKDLAQQLVELRGKKTDA